jgi:hypothetical protein
MPADQRAEATPIAEQVEYVPSPREAPARAVEPVLETVAAPAAPEIGVESVPVADRGDHPPAPPPQPAPEPPRQATSTPLPVHEVVSPPSNPKRGWWRRVTSS